MKERVKALESDLGIRDEEILKLKNRMRKTRIYQLEQELSEYHQQVYTTRSMHLSMNIWVDDMFISLLYSIFNIPFYRNPN